MKKLISNILFTKNRPLQLDAYLQSLYKHLTAEILQTYVLYKQELFDEEYKQLFSKYKCCEVINENEFHRDFLNILDKIDTKYILFGIDDVVYFDSTSLEVIDQTFSQFSDDIF